MALRILNNCGYPFGQFDGYDTAIFGFKGGEVATLAAVLLGTDKASADVERANVLDGYVGVGNKLRPVVTSTLVSGSRPLFLTDDGVAHYGTLFGTVVGGTVGQTSYGPNSTVPSGSLLGPHTALGSGKITLWANPGLYAVTLDACAAGSTGLQPNNGALTVGSALYATTAGLLTPTSGSSFESNLIVGRFVEFTTDNSLVTTPNTLVGAVNSGGGPFVTAFTQAVFYWSGSVVSGTSA